MPKDWLRKCMIELEKMPPTAPLKYQSWKRSYFGSGHAKEEVAGSLPVPNFQEVQSTGRI